MLLLNEPTEGIQPSVIKEIADRPLVIESDRVVDAVERKDCNAEEVFAYLVRVNQC